MMMVYDLALFKTEQIESGRRLHLADERLLSFAKTDNNKEVIREAVFFVRVYCESGKQPEISGFGVKVFNWMILC